MWVSGHGAPDPVAQLEAAAAWCRARGVLLGGTSEAEVQRELERKVADLLGFEAARFLPSGTMAQQIALRVWCDRADGPRKFGMHPTSHLELHEQHGYRHLHGLDATLIGPPDEPMTARHLRAVAEPLGAVLTELPVREAGGKLPAWEELEELKAEAAVRRLPLHLDGARLWQCGAAYGRELREITSGFSSCYVSFYKDIGALAGCMLLGPADFVAEAAVWQARQGGALSTFLPNVVTAAMLLDERLARMPGYLARARELADDLRGLPGVQLVPDPPQVNLFHVVLALDPDQAYLARDRVARDHGLWLFTRLSESSVPGASRFEWTVGEALMSLPPERVTRAISGLLG